MQIGAVVSLLVNSSHIKCWTVQFSCNPIPDLISDFVHPYFWPGFISSFRGFRLLFSLFCLILQSDAAFCDA